MKHLCFLIATVFFVSANAQESTDLEKAIELIQLTGATSTFDLAIDQLGVAVPVQNREAYTKEARGTLGAIYSEMGALYVEEFTPAEIEDLIRFYHTDLGKKLASKQNLMIQKGMNIGQNWGFKVSQIAQKHSEN
ncbi:DUF2059 domain-containing protein [Arenibacter sp. GZD96]|uniref:DUF2059 domain-containing protein n=1 Tax=Aurantibrevibacter litoralis TaxID=3106030 RepID=UPI002AFFCA1C|nr:DUF2059 domain-containing protein [Arenibacter sp. GZD-96]MEA1786636.1 DUF2059 domain-containing protein [Arenibacter sp. GZD-96]